MSNVLPSAYRECVEFGSTASRSRMTCAVASIASWTSALSFSRSRSSRRCAHRSGSRWINGDFPGSRVEQAIGSWRFAGLFVAGGLAGAAMHLVVDPSSLSPLVGCSGSLFAVLAVATTLFGAPMLAFVAVLALTNIAHALGASGAESVSFGAHLGGLFAGFLFVALARLRGGELRRRGRRGGAFVTAT